MLMPSIFGENLFDDWFDFPRFPEFRDLDRAERKLYGRRGGRLMKTDVHELENQYEIDMDLPGFKKDEVKLELENGYLTISAAKEHEEEHEKKGKTIRKERYSGAMQRTFYIGDEVKQEDVKAKFEHGVLSLTIPKTAKEQVSEKKTILIE